MSFAKAALRDLRISALLSVNTVAYQFKTIGVIPYAKAALVQNGVLILRGHILFMPGLLKRLFVYLNIKKI